MISRTVVVLGAAFASLTYTTLALTTRQDAAAPPPRFNLRLAAEDGLLGGDVVGVSNTDPNIPERIVIADGGPAAVFSLSPDNNYALHLHDSTNDRVIGTFAAVTTASEDGTKPLSSEIFVPKLFPVGKGAALPQVMPFRCGFINGHAQLRCEADRGRLRQMGYCENRKFVMYEGSLDTVCWGSKGVMAVLEVVPL